MLIERRCLERLRQEAALRYPEECCGLLVGVEGSPARVTRVIPSQNVHPDPSRRFTLDPATHLRAELEARGSGLAVLGFYHSHPDGSASPSGVDAEEAHAGSCHWILSVPGGRPAELARWRFFEGRFLAAPWQEVPSDHG